jgi:two-component system, NarL family, nitrate/nitrite response regulator NarL
MQINVVSPILVTLIAPKILGWGLQALIKSSPKLKLVGIASDMAAAKLELSAQPGDVTLLELDDDIDEGVLTDFLAGHSARVVALTARPKLESLDSAVLLGLHGIVHKNDAPDVLLTAIEKVSQGELWLDRSATGRIFMELSRRKHAERSDPERARIAQLTAREREAIAALASDTAVPGKVIASRLRMSEHTLRNHLTSIYGKLSLTNRLDLYAYARRHELDKLQA